MVTNNTFSPYLAKPLFFRNFLTVEQQFVAILDRFSHFFGGSAISSHVVIGEIAIFNNVSWPKSPFPLSNRHFPVVFDGF